MADPLSVAASVVGLLTAAAQVSKIIANVIQKARHAPEECGRIKAEVDDIRNVLVTLQLFIIGPQPRQVSRSRTSLIMVEQVVATLAACVTTFSELDTFATALENETSFLDRLRWASKDKEIHAILVRLESHKISLTLMLTILTCQNQDEAESRVDKLCDMVEQMLSENLTLKGRLAAFDTCHQVEDLGDTFEMRLNDLNIAEADGGGETAGLTSPTAESQPKWQRNALGFAFEEVLMGSRAYRLAGKDNSDGFSIISSAGRTASWSMLSGLSLSEISHIGIQAIPIYPSDITNKEHYDFSPIMGDTLPAKAAPDTSRAKLSRRDRLRGLFRGQRLAEPEPETLPAVFGVPLLISIKYANVDISLVDEAGVSRIYGYIPLVVAKTGVFLKAKATEVEDIFATTGNPVRMSELQLIFESPPRYGKNLVWDGYTVHDAAGILLRYLKSLPEPIIPYRCYQSFIEELVPFTGQELTPKEISLLSEVVVKLAQDMPPPNRQLLVYMLDTLSVFAFRSDVNKMTALRLVSTFQPSILSRPPDEMDAEAHRTSTSVAVLLILGAEHPITRWSAMLDQI
ncbi:RhoGAP domain-containing protein [Fusarium austroafricanum]|uniref:RhoGAP domain-containing protein n=1 Tax=Fusarium austroafricanum TaxID=2364996 RepID=A0A8H4JRN9_9HYPO|nr:RhoGAP domain-containing protein [Fusarium austroafricanum]